VSKKIRRGVSITHNGEEQSLNFQTKDGRAKLRRLSMEPVTVEPGEERFTPRGTNTVRDIARNGAIYQTSRSHYTIKTTPNRPNFFVKKVEYRGQGGAWDEETETIRRSDIFKTLVSWVQDQLVQEREEQVEQWRQAQLKVGKQVFPIGELSDEDAHLAAETVVYASNYTQDFNTQLSFSSEIFSETKANIAYIMGQGGHTRQITPCPASEKAPTKTLSFEFDKPSFRLKESHTDCDSEGLLLYFFSCHGGISGSKQQVLSDEIVGSIQVLEHSRIVTSMDPGKVGAPRIQVQGHDTQTTGQCWAHDFYCEATRIGIEEGVDALDQYTKEQIPAILKLETRRLNQTELRELTLTWGQEHLEKVIVEVANHKQDISQADLVQVQVLCEVFIERECNGEFTRSCRAALPMIEYILDKKGSEEKKQIHRRMLHTLLNDNSRDELVHAEEEAKGDKRPVSLDERMRVNQEACKNELATPAVMNILQVDRNQVAMVVGLVVLALLATSVILLAAFIPVLLNYLKRQVKSEKVRQKSLEALEDKPVTVRIRRQKAGVGNSMCRT
jgi:hypothetical protein